MCLCVCVHTALSREIVKTIYHSTRRERLWFWAFISMGKMHATALAVCDLIKIHTQWITVLMVQLYKEKKGLIMKSPIPFGVPTYIHS